MIIAVCAPREDSFPGSMYFRGRPLEFWLPLCLPGINFISPEAVPESVSTVVVCSPDSIPCPDVTDERFSEWVRQLAARDRAFRFGADDLLVMPRKIWQSGKPVDIEPAQPPFGLTFYDARRFPLQVEARVLALQLNWLNQHGVVVEDRHHFFMEGLIPVGKGSVIGPGNVLRGTTRIGENVELMANCWLENAEIEDDCQLLPGCVIRDSRVGRAARIGPFAHLRMQTVVGPDTRVGNFVEIKKSSLGEGSKAAHLTYLGDARVGSDVNVGAGTITCNYDGSQKHVTEIEDGVFVGSGTELVAPVRLGKGSYVAAGSTITEDVPADALAVARQRQRNIIDWSLRKRKKTRG